MSEDFKEKENIHTMESFAAISSPFFTFSDKDQNSQ